MEIRRTATGETRRVYNLSRVCNNLIIIANYHTLLLAINYFGTSRNCRQRDQFSLRNKRFVQTYQ